MVKVDVKEGGSFQQVDLNEGESIIGSGGTFGIRSKSVSPNHAVLTCTFDGVTVVPSAGQQVTVRRKEGGMEVARGGEKCEIRDKDKIYVGEDVELTVRFGSKSKKEKVLFYTKGAAYKYNSRWEPFVPSSFGDSDAPVRIFLLKKNERVRVVCLDSNGNCLLNSGMYAGVVLSCLQPHFVQWNAGGNGKIFGLSFISADECYDFCAFVQEEEPCSTILSTYLGDEKEGRFVKKRDDGESAEQKKAKMDEALSLWAAHDDKGGKEKEKEKEKDKKKEKEKKKGGIFGGKGKSKSSAVAEDEEDPKRAENMKLIDAKVHNIREKKAHEIYVSEVAYVRSVEKVNHCLKQARQTLDEEDIRALFCNIETIYNLNLKFLDDLEKRLLEWKSGDVLIIGDVMQEMIPYFKMYEEYYKNYQNVAAKLMKMEKSKKGKAFLHHKIIQEKTQGQGLPNLLIQPCQRLIRYVLLLAELLKETKPDHPDYNALSQGRKDVQSAVDHMNESVRIAEGQRILQNITKHPKEFIGFDEILMPHRKLFCECAINGHVGGDVYYAHMYVFSDIAVFCSKEPGSKTKIRVVLQVPLMHLWYDPLMEMVDSEPDQFQVMMPHQSFIAKTLVKETKDEFLVGLDGCVRKVTSGSITDNGYRKFKYTFENQDVYEGEWSQGSKHGEGVLTMAGGNVYKGFFKSGKFAGEGTIVYKDAYGCDYTGDWRDNKPHGYGVFKGEGVVYDGEWRGGKREGKGKMVFVEGEGENEKYEGEWKNDLIDGKGLYVSKRAGVRYEGEWKKCRFDGKGALEAHFGKYDGDWVNGQKDGKGTIVWYTGDVYTGEWKNDNPHGQGKMTSNKKVTYEGSWASGKYDGQGKLCAENSHTYTGDFAAGKYSGQGVFETTDGAVYVGDWVDNKKEGKGKYTTPNGAVYEGTWHNDKRFGKGIQVVEITDEPMATPRRGTKKDKKKRRNLAAVDDGERICPDAPHGKSTAEFLAIIDDNFMMMKEFMSNDDNVQAKKACDEILADLKKGIADAEGDSQFCAEMEGRLSTIMVLRKRLLKASSSNSAPGSMAGEAKKKRVMYDGGWVKDKMEGHGFCKMASGATYSGMWTNSDRHGKGVFDNQGVKYTGDWTKGQRNGFGTFEDDGGVFEGNWKDDKRNGTGVYTSKNLGYKYEGAWEDDKMNGEGTFTFESRKETPYKVNFKQGSLESSSFRTFPPPLPPAKSIFKS